MMPPCSEGGHVWEDTLPFFPTNGNRAWRCCRCGEYREDRFTIIVATGTAPTSYGIVTPEDQPG
jgi:hypothetical protein